MQRQEIDALSQKVFEKDIAMQGLTNMLKTLDGQVTQMDARVTECTRTIRTNEDVIAAQKREIARLQAANGDLTVQVGNNRTAAETLAKKLEDAYDGIQKQNASIKDIIAQRDEYVQKLNASVKDRNEIVGKYNELVAEMKNLQVATSSKTSDAER